MNVSKKIVLVGHFGVGKTSLVRRYVDSAFSEDYLVTLGVQVKKKTVDLVYYQSETYPRRLCAFIVMAATRRLRMNSCSTSNSAG